MSEEIIAEQSSQLAQLKTRDRDIQSRLLKEREELAEKIRKLDIALLSSQELLEKKEREEKHAQLVKSHAGNYAELKKIRADVQDVQKNVHELIQKAVDMLIEFDEVYRQAELAAAKSDELAELDAKLVKSIRADGLEVEDAPHVPNGRDCLERAVESAHIRLRETVSKSRYADPVSGLCYLRSTYHIYHARISLERALQIKQKP